MPRPRKCRKVCHYPDVLGFEPIGVEDVKEEIFLTIDEYETIRLIDREGLSQEQCGEQMQIARTTVQMIYSFPYRLTRIIVFSGRAREAPLNRPKLTFPKWATPIEPDRREASWQGKTLAAPIYGGQRSSPEPAAAVGCRHCPLIHPHSASALWGAALRIRSNEES